ncbi:glycosyl transferase family protein [Thiomicrorhabdus sp.]|uniref:glycosyl transferase family protein n=1 Tax=Thiomicrorhabdus sp. TaxID=2039724 RepID=UPI0035671C8C
MNDSARLTPLVGSAEDHPFSEYLRILGKGPKSRRSLTVEETRGAVQHILQGTVTDKQLGAFLLLMRANGESQEELVGIVSQLRESLGMNRMAEDRIDLDWSAYAGKWRYPPYFLLSIKLLAEAGYRILLHGDMGQFQNRQYVESFLQPLGFSSAASLNEARDLLQEPNLVYLPLNVMSPKLKEILHLKSELGVRTVFNTAVKLLNPLNAQASIQGIFHKGVEELHHAVAESMKTPKNLVFKGEGGEAEIRPDALTHLYFTEKGKSQLSDLTAGALIDRQERPKQWLQQDLLALWQGELEDTYGYHAVIGSAGAALMLLEGISYEKGVRKARELWERRSLKC